MKLTEWYPGDVKPVRVGVYQQRDGGLRTTVGYQFWDGKYWGIFRHSPELARRDRGYKVDQRFQNDPWRGVAK